MLGPDTPTPDHELRREHLPPPDASEIQIHQFALSVDGYDEAGGFEPLADLANTAHDRWGEIRELPDSLNALRRCLFFEQRRWHHYGDPMDDEALEYARALIAAMWKMLPA